jgi:hypothetical protein
MENFKIVLWSDSWHAKSWEGGHEELPAVAPSWEYAAPVRQLAELDREGRPVDRQNRN